MIMSSLLGTKDGEIRLAKEYLSIRFLDPINYKYSKLPIV
jgi:hypothetical protein